MKNDKGAIALFSLLAMMFFLIFIMVAYNNMAIKGKTQVEMTSVLRDEYATGENAAQVIKRKVDKTAVSKTTVKNGSGITIVAGKTYAYNNGKISLLKE